MRQLKLENHDDLINAVTLYIDEHRTHPEISLEQLAGDLPMLVLLSTMLTTQEGQTYWFAVCAQITDPEIRAMHERVHAFLRIGLPEQPTTEEPATQETTPERTPGSLAEALAGLRSSSE